MRPKPPFPVLARSLCALALSATALGGCATQLDNPDQYTNPYGGNAGAGGSSAGTSGSGGTGGSNAAGTSNGGTDSGSGVCDAPTLVFQVDGMQGGCNGGTCHTPANVATFPPDLISPNPETRLLDVVSNSAFCPGKTYIDTTNIDNSLILQVIQPNPPCAVQMPFNLTPLTPEKIQCVRDWVQSVIAADQ